MAQNIFKRYEKKYMLTPQQYRFLREHLQGRMKIDEYGLHTICSIYFDTDDYALIRASLQKPVYKEKLRLRSYGIPSSCDETVFLELKKKYTVVIVTHNMQQAARISDRTAFFLLGEIVEYDATQAIFSMPHDKRTEDYITGRFG